ncbi:MAG: hypothetical protein ACU0CO_18490 [Shimia sp.]
MIAAHPALAMARDASAALSEVERLALADELVRGAREPMNFLVTATLVETCRRKTSELKGDLQNEVPPPAVGRGGMATPGVLSPAARRGGGAITQDAAEAHDGRLTPRHHRIPGGLPGSGPRPAGRGAIGARSAFGREARFLGFWESPRVFVEDLIGVICVFLLPILVLFAGLVLT